jgi:predicted nucleic acid-binding protein
MTLCDTGPMVALIDEDDPKHLSCDETLEALGDDDLLTTWPSLTEALHLANRVGGYPAQRRIWQYISKGLIQLHRPGQDEWRKARELMRIYADAPMDFADASLVVVAELLRVRRIFTLDRHFRAYRINGQDYFDVVP